MATILGANTLSSGFDVANSVRFNSADSASMEKNAGTPTDNNKWTFSAWVKRSKLGSLQEILYGDDGSTTNYCTIRFNDTSDTLTFKNRPGSTTSTLTTNAVFRDVAAWYHLVVVLDTSNGTAANRDIIYINGVRETSYSTESHSGDGDACYINFDGDPIKISKGRTGSFFDGYMSEVYFIDGQALAADSFGEFDEDSGIWKPIDASGLTFGNNGFYLDFKASGNLGNDANGGTDLTETNLAATDQTTDTCTNNFATLNSRDIFYVNGVLSEGNCKYVGSSGNYDFVYSTLQVTKGKWYFEGTYKAGDSDNGLIGITGKAMTDTANYLGKTATHEFAYIGNQGRTVTGGSFSTSGSYDAFTHDDVIGVAVDLDNNKIYYSKNGTFQNSGDPTSGATGTGALAITAAASTTNGSYALAVSSFDSDDADEWEVNFGNPVAALSSAANDGNGFGSFEYAPPSGYLALCTKNLATDG